MTYIIGTCTECNNQVEVYCNGDNPLMCPECRSVDTIESEGE